ncbi:MAG: hypothetical protein IJ523_12370 [Succinivibrionaceae bacterium]|nr:hypothetical protein [Succinivibrionaceae bacterium]
MHRSREKCATSQVIATFFENLDTSEQEVTFFKYVGDAGQATLKTAAENGSNIWVKVQWANGDEAKFQAAISGYAIVGGGNEDGVRAKITMRINGDVSFTDAS